MKEKANEAFKQENYEKALEIYDQAIDLTPPEETQDIAIFHNNRGICYQRLKRDSDAKGEFTKAVEMRPEYVKPRGFRMKILREEGEFEQALEDAKRIEELDPMYPGIHKQVVELEKLHKEKFEKMKTEVIGNLKNLGNMVLGKFGMSLDNFKMNQNPDGTYNIGYENK